jgi:hypothetical protein
MEDESTKYVCRKQQLNSKAEGRRQKAEGSKAESREQRPKEAEPRALGIPTTSSY